MRHFTQARHGAPWQATTPEKTVPKMSARNAASPPSAILIRSFGGLRVYDLKANRVEGACRTIGLGARQRQLLRWLLLARWGAPLEVTAVADAMWPGADGAAAASNFASAIRRLRVLLGGPASILIEDGTVALDHGCCGSDLDLLHGDMAESLAAFGRERAEQLVWRLLEDLAGDNPVLLAPPDNQDMAERIAAVGLAWSRLVMRLSQVLQCGPGARLVMQLCERLERHRMADPQLMAQWQSMARRLDAERPQTAIPFPHETHKARAHCP
ncbi:hypothetical protein GT347_19610 [Xylophilus rhododendri]|uniref:Bacterial transcriptional activator domain-containing protein n=1 Tax=Xylophilus rhododendri TaxID=2697032 RepID=A0A857JAI5_9BURK|nr:hypothetical protein [Xylophilus rhododendri]QHI99992.1 hypothetical protein GT347_19610 [Xylophilus rhododendri]